MLDAAGLRLAGMVGGRRSGRCHARCHPRFSSMSAWASGETIIRSWAWKDSPAPRFRRCNAGAYRVVSSAFLRL